MLLLEEGGEEGEKSERFYRGSFISAADNHFPSVCIDFSTASLHVVITPAFWRVVSGGCCFLLAETSSVSAVHLYFSHHLAIIHPAKVMFYVVLFNHSAFCISHNLLGLLGVVVVVVCGVGWRGKAVYSLLSSGSVSVCTCLLASLMGTHLLLFIRGPLKAAGSQCTLWADYEKALNETQNA